MRFSEKEARAWIARSPKPKNPQAKAPIDTPRVKKAPPSVSDQEERGLTQAQAARKSQSPETSTLNAVTDSLKSCRVRVMLNPISDEPSPASMAGGPCDFRAALTFEGARLLSVNQIFSALSSRPHDLYRYKAAWHALAKTALIDLHRLLKINQQRAQRSVGLPLREHVRLTLVRRAPKAVDRDALPTMFKFLIDGLRTRDPIIANLGGPLLEDDHPGVVCGLRAFDLRPPRESSVSDIDDQPPHQPYAVGVLVEVLHPNHPDLELAEGFRAGRWHWGTVFGSESEGVPEPR